MNVLKHWLVHCVTALNLLTGMSALLAASVGHTEFAAWSLLACVILDAVDGFLARYWRVVSDFGAQFDSLADMTSFNVAAGALAFYWLHSGVPVAFSGAACGLYVLMGALRLARFNTEAKQEGEFQGMPTTAAATLVAATHLTYPQMDHAWGVFLIALLGVLMMSIFPYPKGVAILRYPIWFWAPTLTAFYLNRDLSTWVASVAYILSGPAISMMRQKRSEEASPPPA